MLKDRLTMRFIWAPSSECLSYLQKKHSGPSNADEALKLRERLGVPHTPFCILLSNVITCHRLRIVVTVL